MKRLLISGYKALHSASTFLRWQTLELDVLYLFVCHFPPNAFFERAFTHLAPSPFIDMQHDSVARYSRDFVKHIFLGHGVFTSADTIEVAGKKLKFDKVRPIYCAVLFFCELQVQAHF